MLGGMETEYPPMVSISEAARLLRRSRQTVYTWLALGKLRAVRIGAQQYLLLSDVEAIARQQPPTPPQV